MEEADEVELCLKICFQLGNPDGQDNIYGIINFNIDLHELEELCQSKNA